MDGQPILLDSGTYSYHDTVIGTVLRSPKAHNAVHSQTPWCRPISQFLFADWPQGTMHQTPNEIRASFTTWAGEHFQRTVQVLAPSIIIEDQWQCKSPVELHWPLTAQQTWKLNRHTATSSHGIQISMSGDSLASIHLGNGLHSRYYLEVEPHPSLMLTLSQNGTLRTCIKLSDN